MNKNLFIYSFKYLAVLLALVTFSSCERDEFTEADAYALEQQRLELENTRNQDNLNNDVTRLEQTLRVRQQIEALTRANAGGRVLYSVVVVPGSDAAFSSGRFEEVEGLDGAVVTVSQFTSGDVTGQSGISQEVTTNAAGVASFELYSGEVTVSIVSDNYGTVNYTANLTPDGGVANGAHVAVSNVIPVFENPLNPPAGTPELAEIKGFAFAETDITFGNNFEEPAPDGVKVRAFIDVNAAFMAKYVNPMNGTDEGTNINGNITKSGIVRRIAYENAVSTTGTTVLTDLTDDSGVDVTDGATQGGFYSVNVPGTASGLPIKMKFDDFAANRTYVFGNGITQTGSTDGDFGTGTKRFLYTQNTEMGGNQTPTPFFTGESDLAAVYSTVNFDFVTTDATATASIAGGDRVSAISVSDGGYYYEAPTVTIGTSASGVTATGTATLVDIPATATGDAADARDRGLKMVGSVTVTSGGSGYAAAPAVTFTRKSYTGRVGGVPVANGTGSVAAPSSQITYIRIMNGGFGMTPSVAPGTPVTGVGAYTGVAPGVVFNNNIIPTGGSLATATAIVDETVGTVTEVQLTGGGDGYDDTSLNITFNYGENGNVSPAAAGDELFIVDAAGALNWNNGGAGARNLTGPGGDISFNGGTNYTFVPSITATGLTAPAGATLPTFVATVTNGVITGIEIQGATSGWGAVGTEINGTININANPDAVGVSAEGFTQGGSIDSYILTNYGTTNDVYQSTVTAAGESFDYLTTLNDGSGTIVDGNGVAVAPADYADNSDFIVVFENPTAGGGVNAWGYPIFDNSGNSLVGLFIVNQGIGYTNPAPAAYNFWVIPADLDGNKGTALAEYAQSADGGANANASASLNATNLTITFDTPGSGYAVRPEFRLSGGNQSAEDLAAINTAINGAIRNNLTFNEAGEITNTSLSYTGALPFSAADLATNPVNVAISVARLENEFTASANSRNGTYLTPYAADASTYAAGFKYWLGTNPTTDATAFFTAIAGTVPEITGTYITPPTFNVTFGDQDATTGGTGTATLNPSAMIDGLTYTPGSFPTTAVTVNGVTVTSFLYNGNDPYYNAMGERFRTIGGASSFDVYSGMTYIRDVNYGTGIELE
ncbi:hypothetical protein [Bernardetia sp. MNP-M8]|uniref:beta strand repeat-containing protein n=1 Tax=Bernardetia sp. MNP-M8 TaxID=3127470 RepID=UPI0030D3830C